MTSVPLGAWDSSQAHPGPVRQCDPGVRSDGWPPSHPFSRPLLFYTHLYFLHSQALIAAKFFLDESYEREKVWLAIVIGVDENALLQHRGLLGSERAEA